MQRKVAFLFTLLLTVSTVPCAESTEAKPERDTIKKGLGCLVAQTRVKDDLQKLGIAIGSTVFVKAGSGTIPGISPETPGNVNLLLYAAKAQQGRMFFFRMAPDGRFVAIRNSYRLMREGKGWLASEGNGGIATYKAISEYATELGKQPSVRIKIMPQSNGCQSEE